MEAYGATTVLGPNPRLEKGVTRIKLSRYHGPFYLDVSTGD